MTFTQTILTSTGVRVASKHHLHEAPGPSTYLHQVADEQKLISGVYFVVETFSDQSFSFHRIQLTKVTTPTYTTHSL